MSEVIGVRRFGVRVGRALATAVVVSSVGLLWQRPGWGWVAEAFGIFVFVLVVRSVREWRGGRRGVADRVG